MDELASQLRVGVSLAGLLSAGDAESLRETLDRVRILGFAAVQLDVAVPGLRPRELDRSARRDVAALLRRSGLLFSGVELWVPQAHWADPTHLDRAVAAVTDACGFVTELVRLLGAGRPIVAAAVGDHAARGVTAQLAGAADRIGAIIADHAWSAPIATAHSDAAQIPALTSDIGLGGGVTGATADPPPARAVGRLAFGIDPATVLLAHGDPARAVLKSQAPPVSARLSDLGPLGRAVPQSHRAADSSRGTPTNPNRLDRLAYEVALVSRGFDGPLVLDLRGVPTPVAAAGRFANSEFGPDR